MSAIDQYKHVVLGAIECPSDYDFVLGNSTRKISIYQLKEDIPKDECDFDGKEGDLILGGGSGEAAAFRISLPESILFMRDDDQFEPYSYDEIYKSFWSPTFSYKIGNGFQKLGWDPNTSMEMWLTEFVIDHLTQNGSLIIPNE